MTNINQCSIMCTFKVKWTLCMVGNFSCYCCHLLTIFKINFSKNPFRNTIRVSNSLDRISVLIWVQTVCKGQQTKNVTDSMERVKLLYHTIHTSNVTLHLVFHRILNTQFTCINLIQVKSTNQIDWSVLCNWIARKHLYVGRFKLISRSS